MGRRQGSVPCYYFYSLSKGQRVTWFFASRKEANKWRNNTYWKWFEFGSLEHYLETVPSSRKVKEREIWIRHRDSYNDLVLKQGIIKYE